jgi:uncharacterized membrane protein YedE/YeeE
MPSIALNLNIPATQLYNSHSQMTKGSLEKIIVSGVLVGFGTKLGNGCTSGHGVCGLPLLRVRSLVAVLCFMGSAMVVANLGLDLSL